MRSWLVVINDYEHPLVSSVVEADNAGEAINLAIANTGDAPWQEISVLPVNVAGQPLTRRVIANNERGRQATE